jgi:predicted RNase H-like nuclease (RuvC/YqgF family)
MNLDDIILPSLTGAIGAFVSWLIGRKKENVEVQGSEITNTQEAIKIWREMAEEMSNKVKELSDKVDALTTEVQNLRGENAELKHKLGLDGNESTSTKKVRITKPKQS